MKCQDKLEELYYCFIYYFYILRLISIFNFQSGDIEVLTKTSVESIDTDAKIINLSNNEQISFDALFIASGMS